MEIVFSRGGTRNPLRTAVGKGRAAVERRRRLEADPGESRAHSRHEAAVLPEGLFFENRTVHADARLFENADAASRHEGIRIARPDDDAREARLAHRKRAGRRAPVMRTRLQRHVERGALGVDALFKGVAKRHHFGVRTARALREALRKKAVVPNDQGADRRVGRGEAFGSRSDFERPTHPLHIGFVRHAFSEPSRRIRI